MPGNEKKHYDLEDRLVEFAVSTCQLAEDMPSTKVGKLVTNQLLRCSTSPAPNYGEAQSAESRKDFIHKLKICVKELRETRVWLRFAARMELLRPGQIDAVLDESDQLIAIFVKSISTARKNQQAGQNC